MNATDESAFYRAQGQQQADAAWEAKGAGLSPAKCARLSAAMARWAEGRLAERDVGRIEEANNIPVLEAEPMICKDKVQVNARGRTGGSIPPTGAI